MMLTRPLVLESFGEAKVNNVDLIALENIGRLPILMAFERIKSIVKHQVV